MSEFFQLSGPWFWFIAAGVLLIGELLSPGVFMMWLAAAAALTGLADLLLGLQWSGEVICFAALALLLVLASWKRVTQQWTPVSDQPHLNQRHHSYVGRSFVLEQGIVNGVGKLRIEDALWNIVGPDCAAGTRIKIMATDGLTLVVEKV